MNVKLSESRMVIKEINLVVDYSQSLSEMITAGNYDWKNSVVNEKYFTVTKQLTAKRVVLLASLFCFSYHISSDEVINEMYKIKFKTAALPELLALGANYPELQRQFTIIALGSIFYRIGGNIVPGLYSDGIKRKLSIDLYNNSWHSQTCFLGIKM